MEIRHPMHPEHTMALDTEDLRANFLIDKVFVPGQITLTYSHIDRIIIGGICPTDTPLQFDDELAQKVGTGYLLERRDIVMRNNQAVISPSWSIHTGVGTKSYAFIWAMAGENQVFEDMDFVDMRDLR